MRRRTFVTATLAVLAIPAEVLAQPAPQAPQTPPAHPPVASGVTLPSVAQRPLITAQNALESAFLVAADDETKRAAFRAAFLASPVALALSSTTPEAPPRQIDIPQGAHACLIFTSSARATEVMGANAPRVMLTGREALERVRGANVVININLRPFLTLDSASVDEFLALPGDPPRAPAPVRPPPESAGPSQ